jgi:uracil-DNA glycosylase
VTSRILQTETSPHFCRGNLPVAFVYSVPGRLELEAMRPLAGDTGKNLDTALAHLHSFRPDLFPSESRYDYRITNSFDEPLWPKKDNRSEPKKSWVMDARNIARVKNELNDCNVVILCGRRSHWLRDVIMSDGRAIVVTWHTATRALRGKFTGSGHVALAGLWAKAVLEKLKEQGR